GALPPGSRTTPSTYKLRKSNHTIGDDRAAPRNSLDERPNNNGDNGHNGSPTLSEKVLTAIERKIVTPPLDLQCIRTTAIASGRSGETNIHEMATRAFNATNVELEEEAHELTDRVREAKDTAAKHKEEISGEMQ